MIKTNCKFYKEDSTSCDAYGTPICSNCSNFMPINNIDMLDGSGFSSDSPNQKLISSHQAKLVFGGFPQSRNHTKHS